MKLFRVLAVLVFLLISSLTAAHAAADTPTVTPTPTPIVYSQLRCGEDGNVYGRVGFAAGQLPFTVYLQVLDITGLWSYVYNSGAGISPLAGDTYHDFGPLQTAQTPPNSIRYRVANTADAALSGEVLVCRQFGITPTPTATATVTPAATQTPFVVTATPTAAPPVAPTSIFVPCLQSPGTFTVFPNPCPAQPTAVLAAQPAPPPITQQQVATQVAVAVQSALPGRLLLPNTGQGITPPNTGDAGLAAPQHDSRPLVVYFAVVALVAIFAAGGIAALVNRWYRRE